VNQVPSKFMTNETNRRERVIFPKPLLSGAESPF
jgi:hypothetical protein